MEAGHTALPWRNDEGRIYGYEESVGDEVVICEISPGDEALTEFDIANAEFIVRACNEYGALKRKADAMDGLVKALQAIEGGQVMRGEYTHAATVLAYQKIARDALAAANIAK